MKKLIILIAVGLFACGGTARPEKFEPSTRATAQSPEGYTAAEYELATPQGDLGNVKVWSRGAKVMSMDGANRTVVHVGFEVDNSSAQPMELQGLGLDSAVLGRRIMSGIRPARIDGSTTLHPGQVNEIDAYFPLPAGVSPQEVDAFRVGWQIRSSEVTYTQSTPFTASPQEAVVYYYYTPFYDPFYYDWYFYHPQIVIHRYPYRHYHRYR